ncbi:hypothetical protein FQN54_002070 [Arachnomyces sp. PD_36]|nr:hypothetical protein FQN54_002070 [Arachnomyces sp. PD_36]
MRLINVNTLQLEEFPPDKIPRYAILSHTWGEEHEEVSFRDITEGIVRKGDSRPSKLEKFCKRAAKDNLKYAWIDTCCIDKTDSAELEEAISSMFKWYSSAAVCYAYLSDVTVKRAHRDFSSQISSCRWFKRGWTLQELLAPRMLRFYNSRWTFIGTKGQLSRMIEEIHGVPRPILQGTASFKDYSIAQRMCWASKRETKRKEDVAYCLLGVFDVMIPIIYGEGDQAFARLQREIVKRGRSDSSIFAWGLEPASADSEENVSAGLFATSPADFKGCGNITVPSYSLHWRAISPRDDGFTGVNLGLLTFPTGDIFGILQCVFEVGDKEKVFGIPLSREEPDKYIRPQGCSLEVFPRSRENSRFYTSNKITLIRTERETIT